MAGFYRKPVELELELTSWSLTGNYRGSNRHFWPKWWTIPLVIVRTIIIRQLNTYKTVKSFNKYKINYYFRTNQYHGNIIILYALEYMISSCISDQSTVVYNFLVVNLTPPISVVIADVLYRKLRPIFLLQLDTCNFYCSMTIIYYLESSVHHFRSVISFDQIRPKD